MSTITAREASRGFAALLDRVEQNGEEFTIVRDGRVVARIAPEAPQTVAAFLSKRSGRPALDDAFADDVSRTSELLTSETADPWRD